MNDASPAGVPTCYRHPGRETWIGCQRCSRPICPDCMRDAAVGFQCPDCVKQGSKETRQGQATYGGSRSGDPRLTSMVLIGINALVWVAIAASGGASSRLVGMLAFMPRGRCDAPEAGMYFPNISAGHTCDMVGGTWIPGIADGAVWKLLSGAFTHIEIWHVALNMLALYFFGPVVELIFGRVRFLALYLLSALGGSVCALWLADPSSYGVGASGAIFGLLGALGVLALKGHVDRGVVLQNLGLGVVITVVGWQVISWQAHLGGLLVGAAVAAALVYAPRERRTLVQWGAMAALLIVLVALSAVRALALA